MLKYFYSAIFMKNYILFIKFYVPILVFFLRRSQKSSSPCRLPYVSTRSMGNEIIWLTAYFRSEKFNIAEFLPECHAPTTIKMAKNIRYIRYRLSRCRIRFHVVRMHTFASIAKSDVQSFGVTVKQSNNISSMY